MEQKLFTLRSYNGQYWNFFNYELQSYLDKGWLVKDMHVNQDLQMGWVLMEKK